MTTTLGEKLPGDSSRPRTRRARMRAWFLPHGSAWWLVRLRWGRVALLMAAVGLGGYLLMGTLAFLFVRYHREVEQARWADIVLPWRWANYRVARGDHYVAEAQRFVAQGKLQEAFGLARAGVARSPANRAGRILLAELEVAAGRMPYAHQTLLDGLAHHETDPEYWNVVLTFLLQQQEDDRVVELARRYLPNERVDSGAARLLALAAATASYFRGNLDQAEDFLRHGPKLAASRDARLLGAKIERDRGYRELALLQARQLTEDFPRDVEIHRDFIDLLRRQGRHDEARRTSLVFQIAHPDLPGPRIELLQAYRETGESARAAQEVEAILRDFAADRAALQALAEFAAGAGDTDLVQRIAVHAQGRRFPSETYAFLAVEASLTARQYQKALEMVRSLVKQNPEWESRYAILWTSLQAVAHIGLGDMATARTFLGKFLSEQRLRTENLIAVADRLAGLGAGEEARQILARAIAADGKNQAAVARLVELDITLNHIDALPDHVQKLLQMRRPSPDVLRVAQQKLGSDLFLFSPDSPVALAAVREALARISAR